MIFSNMRVGEDFLMPKKGSMSYIPNKTFEDLLPNKKVDFVKAHQNLNHGFLIIKV